MQTRGAPRMNLLLLLTLGSALAACATNPQLVGQKAAFPSADVRAEASLPNEIATAHSGLMRAWQGKDPLAMRPYYMDNAVIVTSSDRYQGWQDMHARWLTPTLPGISNFMAWPTSFTRDGEDILETGRITFRMTQDARVQDVSGTYAHRWQRSPNGLWRVVSANIASDLVR